MARNSKMHMLVETIQPGEGSTLAKHILLCGDDGFFAHKTTDEAHVTCPGCRAIISKRLLAEAAAKGVVLELKKAEHGRYRYAYEAWLNGEHVAYIGMVGAYKRASWRMCHLTTQDGDDEAIMAGAEMLRDPDAKYPHEIDFTCKEDALLAVPAFVASERLKPAAKTIADAKAWRERRTRLNAEWAQEEAAEKELLADTIDGLRSIRDRANKGELVLSNSERVALVAAIVKVKSKAKRDFGLDMGEDD